MFHNAAWRHAHAKLTGRDSRNFWRGRFAILFRRTRTVTKPVSCGCSKTGSQHGLALSYRAREMARMARREARDRIVSRST